MAKRGDRGVWLAKPHSSMQWMLAAALAVVLQLGVGADSVAARTVQATQSTLIDVQRPLESVATKVHRLGRAHGIDGFAGTEFDVPARKFILYWRGRLPDPVANTLSELPPGYSVEVRRSAYSLADLDREIAHINDLAQSSPDLKIVRIGPRHDYSGLIVGVNVAETQSLPALDSQIPITVIRETAGERLDTRQSDTPPFAGGARLTLNLQGWCTTGFEFYQSPSGLFGLTTADHCYENTLFGNGNNTYVVGTSGSCCSSTDTTLITGYSYTPLIYIGAWNSSTLLVVHSASWVSTNQYICSSGSYSGSVCSVRVTDVNQTYLGAGPGYFAQRDDGSPVAGHGDSGGPSYGSDGNGARGYGMIDAGHFQASSCAGVASGTCYYNVFFVNIEDAASSLSSAIVVG